MDSNNNSRSFFCPALASASYSRQNLASLSDVCCARVSIATLLVHQMDLLQMWQNISQTGKTACKELRQRPSVGMQICQKLESRLDFAQLVFSCCPRQLQKRLMHCEDLGVAAIQIVRSLVCIFQLEGSICQGTAKAGQSSYGFCKTKAFGLVFSKARPDPHQRFPHVFQGKIRLGSQIGNASGERLKRRPQVLFR